MFDNIVHFDNKYWKVNLEIFLVTVSIGLLFLYHLILKCVSHFAPHRISLKKDLLVRMRWVVKNMQDPTGMTASVQILRNFVIVASFLASTNSVIAVWVASYIIDRGNTEIPILDFTPSATNQTLLQVKLCIIVFILLVSIACFTVSMRNDIHLSSLLQIAGDSWGVGLEDGVNCIHHSTCSFWAGTRLYFIFFPFLAYVLGPTWMFCATLITLPVLFSQDYLPRAPAAKKLQFYETMDQLEQLRGNPFEAFVPSSVVNRNTTTPAPVPPILTPTAGNPYGVGLEESSPLIQRNKETLRV